MSSIKHGSRQTGLFVVGCLVVLGAVLLVKYSHAATSLLSLESESGTLSGSANSLIDVNASAGKAVKFSASNLSAPAWSDEFDGTSLSYALDGGGGTWRTKGYEVGGTLASGYTDFAGSSWNATPAQIQQYGLAKVANSVLTLKAIRNPGITGVKNAWIGPYLVSNQLNNLTWRYGYFEWRMQLPNPVRGMFPALWLFNNVPGRSNGYEGAEIDMLEDFGVSSGSSWDGGIHWNPSHYNGVQGQNVVHASDDTTAWHRYGINWTPTGIYYLKDGVVRGSITGGGATWFNNANLGIRIDYVMDPNWMSSTSPSHSTPTDPVVGTEPTMNVDYVRYYISMPSNLPIGSTDPRL